MSTILFVEDEAPIRDMVRFALSRAGMEMLEAADTTEAETLLHTRRPDLILLDWMLPEESGMELLHRLRRDCERRDIPVIMLTAMTGKEQKVKGLELGADDYIAKPFSPQSSSPAAAAVPGNARNGSAASCTASMTPWRPCPILR